MAAAGTATLTKKGARTYSRHGLNTLRRALTTSGKRLTSRRYKLGRALWDWRRELVDALGGDALVSPQQLTLIDLSVKTKLLLDSIDAWILTRRSLIDQRRRALLPVVRERQVLADALARHMALLGLERRAQPPVALADLVSRSLAPLGEEAEP